MVSPFPKILPRVRVQWSNQVLQWIKMSPGVFLTIITFRQLVNLILLVIYTSRISQILWLSFILVLGMSVIQERLCSILARPQPLPTICSLLLILKTQVKCGLQQTVVGPFRLWVLHPAILVTMVFCTFTKQKEMEPWPT